MVVSLTYHGTKPANISGIMNTGFNPGRLISVAPGQIFSTNNPAMASRYGTPLKMVTPRSAFSLPSGLLGTGIRGSEVIQSPSAATRGLNLASKLGTEYTGSTAQRLLAGQMVSGLGGIQNPALISRILSSPFGRIAGTALGLPGAAVTSLYGISQQMKPGSALSKFIEQGPANYEKLQNELRLKQMRKTTGGSTPGGIGLRSGRFNYNQAKKALADRVANYNAANTTTKMTATGDVYSVGRFMNKNRTKNKKVGRRATKAERDRAKKDKTGGGFCFDPNTLVKMYDGTEKKIKDIKLGDQTKGGEVTGVFQFKASDEIHDYKGVTVAGSHYVKEDGKFIMVQDSPISVKIDKIPVVHSLDTTGRRIFIKDIEFADYNGDGIAKGFLANAGVDLTGFDKEVLRQVENRLI
tara:strand:- start:74 stop:1303 length:1230 start_codon:yes stop_codon:yes gene_type:complete